MTDPIDTETILKEILQILNKHSLPINSMKLDVSLLTDDFEAIFPEIKDYKAGHFFRSIIIDDIPVVFDAQRRIPFKEVIKWLELYAVQFVKNVAAEVEKEFKDVKADFQIRHYENHPRYSTRNLYLISIECRLRSEPKIKEHNTVKMAIGVSQSRAISQPVFIEFVGWLVDEESGGDWGIKTVVDFNQLGMPVSEINTDYSKERLLTLRKLLLREVSTLVQ